MGVPVEVKEKRTTKIFEQINAEGFPGLMKNINLHIQEVHKLQDKFKEIHIYTQHS